MVSIDAAEFGDVDIDQFGQRGGCDLTVVSAATVSSSMVPTDSRTIAGKELFV